MHAWKNCIAWKMKEWKIERKDDEQEHDLDRK